MTASDSFLLLEARGQGWSAVNSPGSYEGKVAGRQAREAVDSNSSFVVASACLLMVVMVMLGEVSLDLR